MDTSYRTVCWVFSAFFLKLCNFTRTQFRCPKKRFSLFSKKILIICRLFWILCFRFKSKEWGKKSFKKKMRFRCPSVFIAALQALTKEKSSKLFCELFQMCKAFLLKEAFTISCTHSNMYMLFQLFLPMAHYCNNIIRIDSSLLIVSIPLDGIWKKFGLK